MSTTLDPGLELLTHSFLTAQSNGKPEAPISQAAAGRSFWRKPAPKPLRSAELPAEEAWSLYWNKRTGATPIAELCGASVTPLQWSLLADALTPATQRLLDLAVEIADGTSAARFSKSKRKLKLQNALAHWIDAAKKTSATYDLALGCLAAAHIVGQVGRCISPPLGWRILDFLADAAREAQLWNPGEEAAPELVLAQQMLAGELPLTLAYLFPEMAPLYALRRAASDRLSEALVELLNGQGLPAARDLTVMRALLACWTRCRAIGNELNKGRWSKKAQVQYEWLVLQALRWTAPDKSTLLATSTVDRRHRDFLRAALRLGGSRQDATAARLLLGKKTVGNQFAASKKTPKISDNCEWSCLALMRSSWSPADSVVAVDYSAPDMRLDVWAGARRIFAGAWAFDAEVDGKLRRPAGSWENVCWFTDKDVDYAEFTLALEDGASLERQILLAHRDQFLILGDHLKNTQTATLEHAWQLPLGDGLLFCGEGETRDALLVDGKPLARGMPLALPEWRIDPRVGELSLSGGGVRLAQRTHGQSMACPLFVDLRADRCGQPSTWRQLTVAEQLQIQPPDVAVSYRVQAGKDQWLYYRSQGPRGNRTFMGQNTSSEFYLLRFKAPEGRIHEMLEIEG